MTLLNTLTINNNLFCIITYIELSINASLNNSSLFLFASGKGKSSKRDLDNELTIRYFDTVGFLPTKTPPPTTAQLEPLHRYGLGSRNSSLNITFFNSICCETIINSNNCYDFKKSLWSSRVIYLKILNKYQLFQR